MAVGKTQKRSGGKKGAKKKVVEPFAKKEWYDVVAPAIFKTRQFTKGVANKTIGTKLAVDNVMGRVYECNLADLDQVSNRDQAFRKVKLQVQDVQDRNLLTQFHSMEMTNDRLRSLLRKWCTLIEAVIEAKTNDGHMLRVFVMCFTTKVPGQLSKNCYAPGRLVKWMRHRMTTIVQKRFAKCDIGQAVTLLKNDILADQLFKRCNPILPIRDVKIYKVKVVRTPRIDLQKLSDAHGNVPASIEGQARIVQVAAEAPEKEEKE